MSDHRSYDMAIQIDAELINLFSGSRSGGVAVLGNAQSRRHVTTGSAGARLAGAYPVGAGEWTLLPRLSLAYLHNREI